MFGLGKLFEKRRSGTREDISEILMSAILKKLSSLGYGYQLSSYTNPEADTIPADLRTAVILRNKTYPFERAAQAYNTGKISLTLGALYDPIGNALRIKSKVTFSSTVCDFGSPLYFSGFSYIRFTQGSNMLRTRTFRELLLDRYSGKFSENYRLTNWVTRMQLAHPYIPAGVLMSQINSEQVESLEAEFEANDSSQYRIELDTYTLMIEARTALEYSDRIPQYYWDLPDSSELMATIDAIANNIAEQIDRMNQNAADFSTSILETWKSALNTVLQPKYRDSIIFIDK